MLRFASPLAHPPASLFALLLIGAVGCSNGHHKKNVDGGDEDGSVEEGESDASSDSSTPRNPDGSQPSKPDSGGNPADIDSTVPDSGGGGGGGGDGGDAGGGSSGGGDGGDAATRPDGGGSTGGDAGDAGTGTIVSAASISFGPSACGGSKPADQTITFTNPTTTSLVYTATLSATTAFTLTGATNGALSGTVAPGATGSLTLGAVAIDVSATAGQTITANLDVATNAPAPNDHIIVPVTIVPQGATLTLVPSTTPSAGFGVVPINQTAVTLPVKLQNTGNLAANVTVTQPTVTQFTLLSGASAATALVVPEAAGNTPGSVDLTASFAPTFVGPLASSAGLAVSGAVCKGGSSATAISLEGTGSGTGFVASTTTPISAFVNCGATGAALPAGTISVGNFTAQPLTFSAGLLSGAASPFALSTGSATVSSQATSTLTVSVLASAVPRTATPGTVLTDKVVLTPPTGIGLSPIQLDVSTTVQGAVLSFGTVAAFNSATNAAPQAQVLTISNVGNFAVSPTLSVAQGDSDLFAITTPLAPASIPGGSTASPGQGQFTVSFTPPVGDAASKTSSIVLTPGAGDVLCTTAPPSPLPVTGTANTPGFHLDTPSDGTLPFGNAGFVACPAGNSVSTPVALTAAGLHHVRFTNTGSAPLTWTGALTAGNGALFTADLLGGTLLAGDQAVVQLTPTAIPYPANTATDTYSDVFTITTDIVNDAPHPVSLKQTAQGAVIAASATATNFGLVHSGLTSPLNPAFNLQNTGNAGTNLTLTPNLTAVAPAGFTPTAGYPQYTFNGATNSPSTIALAANDSASINGLFAPGPAADDAYESSVAEGFSADSSPLCAPLPTALSFGGTGTAAVVTYAPTSISFPSAPATRCGRTATPITIVVSNTGNQDFDITGLVLGGPDAAQFRAYIGAPGTSTALVPAANNGTPGTAAVTIAPRQIPANNGGVTYNATLTVPYSIAGEPQPSEQIITIVEASQCP